MKHFFRILALVSIVAGTVASTRAGTVDDDWQAVVALDAGPGEPKTPDEAGAMLVTHLARQEKALRGFLAAHPEDTHVFEAKLRLSRLLQIRANLEGSDKLKADAKRLLDELDKSATPEQRPEVEFARIARLMRSMRRSDPAQLEELLNATRHFESEYPKDRRLAALLAEVSTLFDAQPAIKERLLEDAVDAAKDEDLKARVTDDLKRVRLLGKEVPLSFTSAQGQEIKIESLHGHPVFVIFFAAFSPPSMTALANLQQAVASLPAGSVRVLGVCLDSKQETLAAAIKARAIAWPVAFDGKGWEGPLVRGLGINTLPTIWLLDAQGRLRSLNALEGAASQARQLFQEQ